MKGKFYGNTQTRKRGIISTIIILLAFAVAGFSLGLYFMLWGSHNSNSVGDIEIVSAEGKYTEEETQQLTNSLAKFLGVGEDVEVPDEGTSARLSYDIKLEVAKSAADVFEANGVSADRLGRVSYYLESVGHYSGTPLLSLISYIEHIQYSDMDYIVEYMADKMNAENENNGDDNYEAITGEDVFDEFAGVEGFHFDVLGLLDAATDYINYIQNLRKEVKEDLTDDQIIGIILDLIGKGFEAREKVDDAFQDASNDRLGEYITAIEESKRELATKYDPEHGVFFAGADWNDYFTVNPRAKDKTMFTEFNALRDALDEKYDNNVGSDFLSNSTIQNIAGYIYERYINEPQMVHSGVGDLSVTDVNSFGVEDYDQNELFRLWVERIFGSIESNEEYLEEKDQLSENEAAQLQDFLEGFEVINANNKKVTYKGFLAICYQYMNELRELHLERERTEAALLAESTRSISNYIVKKIGESYNGAMKTELRNLTKAALNFTDAFLGLTKILNTTTLKSTINTISDEESELNYNDIAELIREYTITLEEKLVDGKIMTVSDEFYDGLLDLSYPINEMYATVSIVASYTGPDQFNDIAMMIGTVSKLLDSVGEAAELVEHTVNQTYQAYLGVLRALGRENGPIGPAYDALTAIVNDVKNAIPAVEPEVDPDAEPVEDPDVNDQDAPVAQDDEDEEGEEEVQSSQYELIRLLGESGKLPLMFIELIDSSIGRDGINLTKENYENIALFFFNAMTIWNQLDIKHNMSQPQRLAQKLLEVAMTYEDVFAENREGFEESDYNDMLDFVEFLMDVFKEIVDAKLDYSTVTFRNLIDAAFATKAKANFTFNGGLVKTQTANTFYQMIENMVFGDSDSLAVGEGNTQQTLKRGTASAKDFIASYLALTIENMATQLLENYYGLFVNALAKGLTLPSATIDQMAQVGEDISVAEVLRIFILDYDLTNYEFVASWIQELAPPVLQQAFGMLGQLLQSLSGLIRH